MEGSKSFRKRSQASGQDELLQTWHPKLELQIDRLQTTTELPKIREPKRREATSRSPRKWALNNHPFKLLPDLQYRFGRGHSASKEYTYSLSFVVDIVVPLSASKYSLDPTPQKWKRHEPPLMQPSCCICCPVLDSICIWPPLYHACVFRSPAGNGSWTTKPFVIASVHPFIIRHEYEVVGLRASIYSTASTLTTLKAQSFAPIRSMSEDATLCADVVPVGLWPYQGSDTGGNRFGVRFPGVLVFQFSMTADTERRHCYL